MGVIFNMTIGTISFARSISSQFNEFNSMNFYKSVRTVQLPYEFLQRKVKGNEVFLVKQITRRQRSSETRTEWNRGQACMFVPFTPNSWSCDQNCQPPSETLRVMRSPQMTRILGYVCLLHLILSFEGNGGLLLLRYLLS